MKLVKEMFFLNYFFFLCFSCFYFLLTFVDLVRGPCPSHWVACSILFSCHPVTSLCTLKSSVPDHAGRFSSVSEEVVFNTVFCVPIYSWPGRKMMAVEADFSVFRMLLTHSHRTLCTDWTNVDSTTPGDKLARQAWE